MVALRVVQCNLQCRLGRKGKPSSHEYPEPRPAVHFAFRGCFSFRRTSEYAFPCVAAQVLGTSRDEDFEVTTFLGGLHHACVFDVRKNGSRGVQD